MKYSKPTNIRNINADKVSGKHAVILKDAKFSLMNIQTTELDLLCFQSYSYLSSISGIATEKVDLSYSTIEGCLNLYIDSKQVYADEMTANKVNLGGNSFVEQYNFLNSAFKYLNFQEIESNNISIENSKIQSLHIGFKKEEYVLPKIKLRDSSISEFSVNAKVNSIEIEGTNIEKLIITNDITDFKHTNTEINEIIFDKVCMNSVQTTLFKDFASKITYR